MNMEQQPPGYAPKIACITRIKYFSQLLVIEDCSKNYDLIYSTQTEEQELLYFKEISFCRWVSKQRMKSNSERNHTQARQNHKKEKCIPTESINNMLHFNRIWLPIMCGIKVIVLLAISSGTLRQINGKQIWQVISLHFQQSVALNQFLELLPFPDLSCPILYTIFK